MARVAPSQFSVLLGTCIVPAVLHEMNAESILDIDGFYRSKLYSLLSDSETGLWHLSPYTLALMYAAELQGDAFCDPEEQS